MTFKIFTTYLEHSGGTKFYEVVQILEDSGPGLTIKRWGAIGLKKGGGQVMYERGSQDVTTNAAYKILREKRNKGYADAKLDFGLHKSSGGKSSGDELAIAALNHYGRDTVKYLSDYFGLNGSAPVVSEEPPPRAPEVEPERDDRWGSW